MTIHGVDSMRGTATNTSFVTVSFKDPGKPNQPGNYDPSIALRLYEYSTQYILASSKSLAGPSTNPWYYAFLGMYQNLQQGDKVSRSTWWDSVQRVAEDQMAYTCDANMGTPVESDCHQLEASQLGPPSDIVLIHPDAPLVRTINSCTIAIQTVTPIHVTWAQIATAVGVLLQVCIVSGATKSGGLASFNLGQPMPNPHDIEALAGAGDAIEPPNVTGGPLLSGMCLFTLVSLVYWANEAFSVCTNPVK